MVTFGERLAARGQLKAVESLAGLDSAVRVSRAGGRPQTLDGPFAEAKEMLGGFFLLQNVTREQAVALAHECPAAQWCTVEVRALAPCCVRSGFSRGAAASKRRGLFRRMGMTPHLHTGLWFGTQAELDRCWVALERAHASEP